MSSFISKVGRWSILLLILLVSGCGSSSPTESQPSGVQLPDEIVQLRLQDNGSIHAYVEVDGGQKTEMAITGPTAELQLTLTEGSHNIRVILEYLPSSGSGNPIILADTTKPVNVTASTSTPLAFASSDFDFTAHDDDKDGFSNLSEMQSGDSAPVISTVSPAVSSVDVLPASPVVISFDDPIDPDTLDAGIIVMGASSGLVNGTVSYIESTHTASFTPSQALNDGESYTVTIGSAIKNTAGVALSAAVSYSFTINKIPPPPSVLSVTPDNHSVDVAVDTPIIITFNSSMKAITLSDGISLSDASNSAVTGSVSYDDSTHIATFTPEQSLNHEETYTVTVATSVQNSNGQALASEFTSSFTVVVAPPMVTSVIPADNSSDIAIDTVISVTFDSSMNAATLPGGVILSGASSGAVTGSVSYDDNTHTATFTPANSLNYSEMYDLTVGTNVQSSAGVALASAYTSSFTVVAAPPAPTVITVTPSNNSSDIAVDTVISVTFDSSINAATLPGGVTLSGASSGAATGSVSYDDNTHTATFTPSETLNHSEIYTLTVGTSVQNSTGVALASVFTSSFSVVAAPPTVVSVSPSNNSLNVANNTLIKATFDRFMDASTLTASSFSVTGSSSNTVSGSVSYDSASKTATFTPSSLLNYSEVYTARLSTAVQSSESITLASEQSWSFTITAAPVADIAFTLPQTYLQSSLPNTGTIYAYIQVDGATRQAMTLTGSDASTQLTGLTTGSHQFTVILEYALTSDPQAPVILAESTKNISISEGSNSVSFSDSDFDFSLKDDDTDNISNFDEMLSGGTAPVVVTVSPTAGETGVEELVHIKVTFDDPMIASSFSSSSFIVEDLTGNDFVAGSVAYIEATRTAIFMPNQMTLSYNHTYSVVLTTDIQNTASQGLSSVYQWSFTIKEPPVKQVSNVFSPLGTGTPILAYNDSGKGMAVWSDIHVGRSLVYSYFDGTSWSAQAVLSSIPENDLNFYPKLVSNGSGFAVVWREYHDQGSVDELKGSIYEGGSWSQPATINTGFGDPSIHPQLASNGTGYAVTWDEYVSNSSSSTIYARISTGSNWGDAIAISDTSTDADTPYIASNGSGYAVIWGQDIGQIGVNIYTGSWSLATAMVLDNAGSEYHIASNGSGYSVVWECASGVCSRTYLDTGAGFNWSAVAQIEDPTQSLLLNETDNAIVSNGTGYAVIMTRGNSGGESDIYASINSTGGGSWGAPVLLGSRGMNGPKYSGGPIIASGANTYAAIWAAYDGASYNLYSSVYNGATWSSATALENESGGVFYRTFKIDAIGDKFIAVWHQLVNGVSHSFANVFENSSWSSTATQLDNATISTGFPVIKQNAGRGKVDVVWNETGSGIWSKTYDGTSWSTSLPVSSTVHGGDAITPRLISIGNGRVMALWHQLIGSDFQYVGNDYNSNLYANIYENGAWGTPQVLNTGQISDYLSVDVSATTNGIGFAVTWTQLDGLYESIHASVYNGSNWVSNQKVDNPNVKGNSSLKRIVVEAGSEAIISSGLGYTVIFNQDDGTGTYTYLTYAVDYDGSSWGSPYLPDSSILSPTSSTLSFNNNTEYLSVGTSSSNGQDSIFANFYNSGSWGAEETLYSGTVGYQVTQLIAVHSSGSKFAVAWLESNGVNDAIKVVTFDGSNWLPPTTLDSGSTGTIAFVDIADSWGTSTSRGDMLTSNGSDYALVWRRKNNTAKDVYVSLFDGSNWSTPTALVSGVVDILNIQIASNRDGFLAVWEQDDGDGIYDIMSSRYHSTTGWIGAVLMEANDNSSALDLRLTGSLEGYSAVWTQAEPTGDPGTLYPWAKILF